jgi:hypothetical protein
MGIDEGEERVNPEAEPGEGLMGRGFLILLVELAATGAESGPGRGVPIPPVGLQAKQVNDEVHPPHEPEESRPLPDPSEVRPFFVRPAVRGTVGSRPLG